MTVKREDSMELLKATQLLKNTKTFVDLLTTNWTQYFDEKQKGFDKILFIQISITFN